VSSPPSFDVVIPTVGRPSLHRVVEAVLHGRGPLPARLVLVDDRRVGAHPASLDVPRRSPVPVTVRRTFGAGPAAARNVGWLAGDAAWVVFLDDDVEPPFDWRARLADDLAAVDGDASVAGSQGVVDVPLPTDRRPTDWERNVAGLATGRWITADLAYRRRALEAVGGFDERFRHAFREDSDLALQVVARVGAIRRGHRRVTHPVPRASWRVSVDRQRGNQDDALMRHRYGRSWRTAAAARTTRLRRHALTTGLLLGAVVALGTRRRRAAAVGALAWGVATLEFFAARARHGPRRPAELASLVVTSALIPPSAVVHRLRGELRVLRDARADLTPAVRVGPSQPPRAVCFDRDGTLVHDVPYNGDPDAVRPVADAPAALADLRRAGVLVAVVTNQSGIARGLITESQVHAVHRRIERELGRVDEWLVCPHGEHDDCRCRKPQSGLVLAAASRLRVRPSQCAMVGDTEADLAAARAVGARAILVANSSTRPEEVASAPESAPTLQAAVDRLLGVA
jgi:histidinol-phosphate phosphatase family protein